MSQLTLAAVVPPHDPDDAGKVSALAASYDADAYVPAVRVITVGGYAYAIEGSHRIAALLAVYCSDTELDALDEYITVLDGDVLVQTEAGREIVDALTSGRGYDYDELALALDATLSAACNADDQFAPLREAFKAEGFESEVWQTGGMCMCLAVCLERASDGESFERWLLMGEDDGFGQAGCYEWNDRGDYVNLTARAVDPEVVAKLFIDWVLLHGLDKAHNPKLTTGSNITLI